MSYSLVNVWELSNHTLFNDIVLPVGIDKEILVNTIFDNCGELEPITIDVSHFKAKIETFFKRYYNNFDRMLKALETDYNPLDNYDRNSTYTDTTKGVNVNKVSAYDSEDFSNSGRNEDDITFTHTERTRGNIGVTTSAQMLTGEIGVRRKQNIYNIVCDAFLSDLMICLL